MIALRRARRWWSQLRQRRAEVISINRRNVELIYPHNARADYPLADDKLLTKERLAVAGVPIPETLAVCDGLYAVPRLVEAARAHSHFVVKPANGSGGDGILVVGERTERGTWLRAGGGELTEARLQKHLADVVFGVYSNQLEDRVFLERRVHPHPFFHALWPDGLCDVRVITLRGVPVMSMIRVPTRESGGRANLHQGGLGIALELASGRTLRAVHRGRALEIHPESSAALIGQQVPNWSDLLEVARRAARAVPLGYLGVDLVLDRDRGPLVLELNVRPGLEIQNVHAAGLGAAIRDALA